MSKKTPTVDEEINHWQRWFAIECNNRAWDLASKERRTPKENLEMVHAAYAAAFHWSKIGQPINDARADVTLAHILSLAGQAPQAMWYAQRSLVFFKENPGEVWDMAFAHAEMAFAAAVLGDARLHAEHYEAAFEIGETIADDGDRLAFDEVFAKIPSPRLKSA